MKRASPGSGSRSPGPKPVLTFAVLAGLVLAPVTLRAAAPRAAGAQAQAQAETLEERRRVLLVVDTPNDPFMDRIRAEVVSLGLPLVVRAPKGSIEASARAERAAAAIRILPARNGVEVWMADETSGRSLLRQVIVDETAGGPNQNVVALQTAELLRTGLFPKSPPGDTSPATAAPAPVIVSVAPPRPAGEKGVTAGVGLLYSAGGASPAWQASISLEHLWGPRFGLAGTLSAPFRRGTMTGPEGTADVGAITAGVEALARFTSAGGRLFLTARLGAAFVSVLTDGHPSQPGSTQLESNPSAAYTGLGYARLTLGWKLSSWLGLGMSGLAGTTVARVHIRFAGNDEGDWGVPLLGATLFAEVDWR